MKNMTLFLLALLMSSHLMAQQNVVTGTVTDANDGSPLIGANVKVKGTTLGTITDFNGKFSANVPAGNKVLAFSCIGYKTQEITLNAGQRVINVLMKEDSELLDEVVVVGYGTMKKSDLSGASVSVGEDKIKGSIITNLDQALQGRAAGVTSVMTSGAPGSATAINVRGLSTINADAQPLYVVDGVIFQGGSSRALDYGLGSLGNGTNTTISPLSTLNPSDIVSMEILKDASATAIYGSQGANGVVLITTKKGKAGDAKFSYEGLFGIQNQAVRLDMMDLRQYAEYNSAIAATTGSATPTTEYLDPTLLGKGTDWQDAIFREATMYQHNFSAQGGAEKVQYYLSGSYMNQEGTIVSTDFMRYSFRANIDAQMKKWLKVGLNSSYSHTEEQLARAEGSEGILTYSLLTPPDIPVYDAYGNYASVARQGYTRVNPIALADLNENLLERNKFIGNLYMDVTPIKNLTWRSELGFDITNSRTEVWNPTYDFGGGTVRAKNYLMIQRNNSLYWALKNYITYGETRGKHSYSLMFGQEAWESNYESQSVTGSGLPDNTVRNPQLGATEDATISYGKGSSAMASFFGRGTYNYDNRYMGTYTYRRDGSSNFGPKNRWADFQSFALSWRFSNETFLDGLKDAIKLSNGKLRAGWGQSGNQNIGGYKWGASISMMPTGLGNGYRQSNIANPYIKWETQEQWNLGLDLGFFHDRINLTVDLYDKTSKDMLMELQLPSYMGTRGNGSSALGAPWGNYGTINNKGLEITLNTHNLTGKFSWDTDFQISFNKNKLVSLDGSAPLEGYGQWSDVVSRTAEGESLFGFYGYIADGVYTSEQDIKDHLWDQLPSNGIFNRYSTTFVGDTKYRDLNNDGKITAEDKTNIGSPLPKFTYGMTNTFSYKNFDLSVFVHGSYGNKILNYIGRDLSKMDYWSNQLSDVMDFARIVPIDANKQYPITVYDNENFGHVINNWFEDVSNVTVSNPNAKYPRGGQGLSYNHETSSRYVEDGSYLRIKNITFGYTFPSKWLRKVRIEKLRVYANVQNLITFTNYSGYDPEVGYNPQDASGKSFGVDNGRYPSPQIYSFGVNLSF